MLNSHCDIYNSDKFLIDVYICHFVLSWLVYIFAMLCFNCWWLLIVFYISFWCQLLCYSVYSEESILSICVLILLVKLELLSIIFLINCCLLCIKLMLRVDLMLITSDIKLVKLVKKPSCWNWNALIADVCVDNVYNGLRIAFFSLNS